MVEVVIATRPYLEIAQNTPLIIFPLAPFIAPTGKLALSI